MDELHKIFLRRFMLPTWELTHQNFSTFASEPTKLDSDAIEKMYAALKQREEDSRAEIFRDAVAYVCHPAQWMDWHRLFYPKGIPNRYELLLPEAVTHPAYGPQLEYCEKSGLLNILLIPTSLPALTAMREGTFWGSLSEYKGQFKILMLGNDS